MNMIEADREKLKVKYEAPRYKGGKPLIKENKEMLTAKFEPIKAPVTYYKSKKSLFVKIEPIQLSKEQVNEPILKEQPKEICKNEYENLLAEARSKLRKVTPIEKEKPLDHSALADKDHSKYSNRVTFTHNQ